MKKLISLVISLALIACIPLNAFAVPETQSNDNSEIAPCYLYTNGISSILGISGTTATCTSTVTGYSQLATKIQITKTLEKKNGSSWDTKATWVDTFYSFSCSFTNTKKYLSSGTYRVKTVAKVYNGDKYETVTAYSTLEVCK